LILSDRCGVFLFGGFVGVSVAECAEQPGYAEGDDALEGDDEQVEDDADGLDGGGVAWRGGVTIPLGVDGERRMIIGRWVYSQ
jgi:hypothetical protein